MTAHRARRPRPEPRWATMNEAVEYSRIPRRTLLRWIKEGRLPAYRIGPRLIQVDLNDLDRMRRRLQAVADHRETGESAGDGPGGAA